MPSQQLQPELSITELHLASRQARPEHGMTKRSYVEAVLAGTSAAAAARDTDCRLLLSIDRRETTEAALETVQLAADFKSHGVVGIDLSGGFPVGLPTLT